MLLCQLPPAPLFTSSLSLSSRGVQLSALSQHFSSTQVRRTSVLALWSCCRPWVALTFWLPLTYLWRMNHQHTCHRPHTSEGSPRRQEMGRPMGKWVLRWGEGRALWNLCRLCWFIDQLAWSKVSKDGRSLRGLSLAGPSEETSMEPCMKAGETKKPI